MTEWFLCVFTRTLPWPALLRVWDMFLCEGNLNKVAIKKKKKLIVLNYEKDKIHFNVFLS